MKKILMLGLISAIFMVLVGCSKDYTEMLDYENAEEFEAALNDGEDVEGKYVMVEVLRYKPSSAFGYNLSSGEHLNFVDAENPNAEVGDSVVFKVEKVASMFGSFIITYDEHKVIENK